jgi:hypothetical protein
MFVLITHSLLLSPHVGQSLALLLFFALRVASSPYAVVRGHEEGHVVGFVNMLDGISKGRVWVDVLIQRPRWSADGETCRLGWSE